MKGAASKITPITNAVTTSAGRAAGTSKSRRWKGFSVQNQQFSQWEFGDHSNLIANVSM